ncbi:uncharacterized protein LOC132041689 [Lycium ferocissimum]|uniref:uncharacterized protein LOC132041689 n=1 Tax=Lycium ferocissimum TaxID=112874 RepID=UPI00281627D1|nr:uncharacterized protein LOC132041689 [Lycium ferocissimum]
MAKIGLSKFCKQEDDHELKDVRCKHGFLLPLLTSWTPRNPGRRYWSCPYYGGARSCDFYLWKDADIDPRSKFVIPKLVGRIGELEASLEAFGKDDYKPSPLTNSVESKIDMNNIEIQLENFGEDIKKMKEKEKKWKSKLAKSKKREKVLLISLLCICIVIVSFLFQNLFFRGVSMKLP